MWGLVKWAVALAMIGLAGVFAYMTGTSLAEIDVQRKSEQIADLTNRANGLQTENTALRAAASQAQAQARDWEQRYKAEVPTGDRKVLLDLATRKLNEGVDLARLTFLINAAANARVCDAELESKRLRVKTPIGKAGKETSAAFADRKITITADGVPAVNEKGEKESWFDPTQPVTFQFTPLNGQAVAATGIVPLQHQMVMGDSEFHFSIDIDERKGFALVTSERCNFP
jgi:type II secretory pathway component HofQ